MRVRDALAVILTLFLTGPLLYGCGSESSGGEASVTGAQDAGEDGAFEPDVTGGDADDAGPTTGDADAAQDTAGEGEPDTSDNTDPDTGGQTDDAGGQPDADNPDPPQLNPTYSPNPNDCHPQRNRYNCKPPGSDPNKPRVTNPHTGDMYWPLATTTEMMDGYGSVRGTIDASRVKINMGMRKVLHNKAVVYVWAAKLTSGIYASGWIFEENLQHAQTLRQIMDTIWLPNPHKGHYVTQWEVTGGNNAEFQDLTVTKGHSGGGRRATDYLLRPGNVVNLIFNVPGREMGGYSVDTFAPGGMFRRARGVLEDEIPLYNLGGTTPVKYMKFVYGYIHDGSQRRYGWIAKAALVDRGQLPYKDCQVTCCDYEEASFAAESQAECRDAYGWCAGHGAVRHMNYDGQNIYTRSETCTTATYCCALCNNRQDYHRVEGVEWACTQEASEFCSQGSRGGLDDADWRYCTP